MAFQKSLTDDIMEFDEDLRMGWRSSPVIVEWNVLANDCIFYKVLQSLKDVIRDTYKFEKTVFYDLSRYSAVRQLVADLKPYEMISMT